VACTPGRACSIAGGGGRIHIADDTDDLGPERDFAIHGAETAADGIGIRPEVTGERLVDDHHAGTIGGQTGLEGAALHQLDAERGEIVGCHHDMERGGHARGVGGRLAVDQDLAFPAVAIERERGRDGGVLDAWDLRQPPLQPAEEIDAFGVGVDAALGQRKVGDEYPLGVPTGRMQ
jgi:hypothetical protein